MTDHRFADVSPVDLLCKLIAIPSVNPMGRELSGAEYLETRLSDWLVDYFERLGVPHERLQVAPGRSNVLAKYESPGSATTLLIDAHQDTVPVDGMTVPAFEPQLREGRITGRGATDVKGGMAAMLAAFTRLVHQRPPAAPNVVFSASCDEEAGATGVKALVGYWTQPDAASSLLCRRPDAAIVAEPSDLDVIVAHRGATRWRIVTRGRACHSSDPTQGTNAIYQMAPLVSALQQYAQQLPGRVRAHPLCGCATLSVGRIEGGTSVNIVPEKCWIEVDRRVVPGEDRDDVLNHIEQYLRHAVDVDFTFEPPFLESMPLSDRDNGPLAESLLDSIAAVDRPRRVKGVPFGTHASTISAAGVPAVVFGPGSIAQAHTEDEFIEVEQLELATEALWHYLRQGSP